MTGKVSILSIDGGGIRGIIPAVILNHIEKALQRRTGDKDVTLADYFDLIAGTSTGGILACYFLLPPLPGQTRHSRFFAENIGQLKDAGECFVKDNVEVLEGIVDKLFEPGF